MNKLNLFTACLLLLAPTCLFSFSDSLVVFFKTDEYVLESQQKAKLTEYCEQLDFSSDFQLLIKGFADHRGTNGYNQKLAENRALTVKAFLLENDILERELQLVSLGEEESYLQGKDDEYLAPDRKVVVYYKQREYAHVDEFLSELVDNDHRFLLSPKKENKVILPSGARIVLQESCLTDKDGNVVKDDFELRVTEAMNKMQMLSENLSTVSNGQMIETGGMFKIEAFDQQGNELLLDPEKPMSLTLPTDEIQEDMELFTSAVGDNWTPVGQTAVIFSTTDDRAPKAPKVKEFAVPTFVKKEYQVNKEGKPYRPVYLTTPQEPPAPSYSDYSYKIKWYQKPWQAKHQKRMDNAYNYAMKVYDKKLEKYEKRLDYYEENQATYSERLDGFDERFEAWEDREELAAEQFYADQEVEFEAQYARFVEMARKRGADEYERAMEKYKKEMAEYLDWREEQMAALNVNGFNSVNEVSAYAFSLSAFGWINCDRFLAPGVPRAEILVEAVDANPADTKVIGIFKEMDSMMHFIQLEDGSYSLNGIPVNTTATVLSFKVEDGKVFMAKQDTRPGRKLTLEYKPSSYREVTSVIANCEI